MCPVHFSPALGVDFLTPLIAGGDLMFIYPWFQGILGMFKETSEEVEICRQNKLY